MTITPTDLLWLTLASSLTTGLLIILSALVTGYLVFRSKRENHETLFPRKMRKSKGPIVMDEFASETAKDSEEGLPEVIRRMNEKMGESLALSGLKREK